MDLKRKWKTGTDWGNEVPVNESVRFLWFRNNFLFPECLLVLYYRFLFYSGLSHDTFCWGI